MPVLLILGFGQPHRGRRGGHAPCSFLGCSPLHTHRSRCPLAGNLEFPVQRWSSSSWLCRGKERHLFFSSLFQEPGFDKRSREIIAVSQSEQNTIRHAWQQKNNHYSFRRNMSVMQFLTHWLFFLFGLWNFDSHRHQQIFPLFLILMIMPGYAIIAYILTAPSPFPFRHTCEQHLQYTLHTHHTVRTAHTSHATNCTHTSR